jgi:hypothetical protein
MPDIDTLSSHFLSSSKDSHSQFLIMAPITNHTSVPTATDFDVIQNRVAVAMAKRERLIKSWTASSSRPRPRLKSQEELDAEDADLYRIEPPRLGLGAPIPAEYQNGDISRKSLDLAGRKSLSQAMLGKRAGFQASKPRDVLEKVGSAKRGLKEESSDEEEGRSGLGRSKKAKTVSNEVAPAKVPEKFRKTRVGSEEVSNPVQARSVVSTHVPQVSVKSQVKKETRIGNLPQKQSPLHVLNKQYPTFKKPLVDYSSDTGEGDDDNSSTGSKKGSLSNQSASSGSTKIAKANSSLKNGSKDTVSSGLTKAIAGSRLAISDIIHSPGKTPGNSSIQGSKANSKDSKNSSTTSASSDSEPSDMDTVIPTPLTVDAISRASVAQAAESMLSPAEKAKRDKNREKKAKKKERKKREKEAALLATTSGTSSVPGPLTGKKLKDRLKLADAN